MWWEFLLYLGSVVSLGLATVQMAARVSLLALGLTLFVLVPLINTIQTL